MLEEAEIYERLVEEFGADVIIDYVRPEDRQLVEIARENDELEDVEEDPEQREELLERIREEHADDLTNSDNWIQVHRRAIDDVCRYLKETEELAFDSLMCLSGMDWEKEEEDRLGVTYHLHSMTHLHRITLKVFCPKEDTRMPSVSDVWGGANWHEREAYDLYGIHFENHPYLKRMFCPQDWEGHPLRKDYDVQEYYRNVRVPY